MVSGSEDLSAALLPARAPGRGGRLLVERGA